MAEEFFTRVTPKLKTYCITEEQIESLKACTQGKTTVAEVIKTLTAYPSASSTPLELQQSLAGLWTLLIMTAVGLADAQSTIISTLQQIRTFPWEEEPTGEGEEYMDFDDGYFWRELTLWGDSWSDDYNHYAVSYTTDKPKSEEDRVRRQTEWINTDTFSARLALTNDETIALRGNALDMAARITMRDLERDKHEDDPTCIEAASQVFIHAAPELLCLVRPDPDATDMHSLYARRCYPTSEGKKSPLKGKWDCWRERWAALADKEGLLSQIRGVAWKALEAMDRAGEVIHK